MRVLNSPTSSKKEESDSDDNTTLLPILIIPGFMSSGLELLESDLVESWVGKRIYLNIAAIGISAMYFGKAQKREVYSDPDDEDFEDDEEAQQYSLKSKWLKHMLLADDRESDPPGVKVRVIPGIDGVAYVAPGALTSGVSWVFAKFIDAMVERGYKIEGEDANIMAAPYDWRMAPSTLENRDQYFTNTIGMIEELYSKNNSTPVVLVCHSMGCKAAHYLLNFALDVKGQDWIDKHIHTYMPIGGPHLGAPLAMQGAVSGVPMQLGTFLSKEEQMFYNRTLGSGPWLVPSTLPEGVPASNYILPHGCLEISIAHALDTHPLVKKRSSVNRPKKYQLMITGKGFHGSKEKEGRTVRSFFHRLCEDAGDDVVVFKDEFSFATETKPYYNETLQFMLQEPGLALAKRDQEDWQCNPFVYCLCCLCIPCMLAYKLIETFSFTLFRGATLTADAIARKTLNSTTLAFSEEIKIPESVWSGKKVTIKVPLYHEDDYGQFEGCCMAEKANRTAYLYVELKWNTFNSTKSFARLCSPVCRPSESAFELPVMSKYGEKYQEFSGYDILEREGSNEWLRFVKRTYDDDKHHPRNYSSRDPPPVKRIHALYGFNVPTEIGCVYSRQDTCLSGKKLQSRYVPDKDATIDESSGFIVVDGVIKETPETVQPLHGGVKKCGDGTVPYWSLAHVKTWNSEDCKVTVQEFEGSVHKPILGEDRLHQAVWKYVSGQNGVEENQVHA